jgi:hypothetical protein
VEGTVVDERHKYFGKIGIFYLINPRMTCFIEVDFGFVVIFVAGIFCYSS